MSRSDLAKRALEQAGGLGALMGGQIAQGIRPPSEEYIKGKEDLYFLCTDILGYRDLNKQLHGDEYIKEYLDTDNRYKLDMMPRGHLKTTVGTIGKSIQEILNDPNIRILLANAIWDNARSFLKEIKDHFEKNDKFRQVYGDLQGDKWNNDEIVVSLRTKARKEPTIATSGLERSLTSQHYDLIIADDLVTRENIGTNEQIKKVINFYKDLLDLMDSSTGRILIHGTKWHYADLYNWIVQMEKDLKKAGRPPKFKIIIRMATEKGRIIFPEKFSRGHLLDLLDQKKEYQFLCQYYNYAIDIKNALCKRSQINHYTQDQLDKYLKDYPLHISMAMDGAVTEKTDKNDPDQTAITVCGTTIWDERILLACEAGWWNPSVVKLKFFELLRSWKPNRVGMQKVVLDKMYKYILNEALRKEENEDIRRFRIEEIPVSSKVSKSMRIRALQPRFASGTFFWKDEHSDFEDQATQYPNSSHDDILDSIQMHDHLSEVPMHKKDKPRRSTGETINEQYLPWNM